MAKRKSKAASSKGGAGSVKYPRNTLDQALRVPRAIIEQNAGKECTPKEAAAFLGIKATGPFGVEVASAAKFGLLERPSTGKIVPTDLAKKIVRPQDPKDELQALRTVVLQTPVISDVYNHYRGENLPDEKFLANALTDKFGIAETNVPEFREILISSLEKAQLLSQHGDKARVIDVTSESSLSTVASQSATLEKLSKAVKVSSGDSCFVVMPFADPHGGYYEKVYAPADVPPPSVAVGIRVSQAL